MRAYAVPAKGNLPRGDVMTKLDLDARERAADERGQSAEVRLANAGRRDTAADASDVAAHARDRAADARDTAMVQTDADCARSDGARAVTGAEVVIRAAGQRKRAEGHRGESARQRMLAAGDRRAAARDRAHAARQRRSACADRVVLTRLLAHAETDPLTGARTRTAGLLDLDRELDRCRRATGLLVVAYVEVVGRPTVDDSADRSDGDELLRNVVALMREHLRSYDLIVRVRHDEFLCAMSDLTLRDAHERFSLIADALVVPRRVGTIKTAFVELAADETAVELIARAHAN
jgi:diguanylate cyclase (GGDEF)-like protein